MTTDRSARPPQTSAPAPAPGATIPHDPDVERALIGAALLRPTDLEVLIRDTRPEDFYTPVWRRLRIAIEELDTTGTDRLDPTLLASHVATEDRADVVSALAHAGTGAARLAQRVHDLATKRRLLAAGAALRALGADHDVDAHQGVTRARDIIEDLAANNGARSYSSLITVDFAGILTGNIEPERTTILRRSDGRALLYPGKMHTLTAEPSAGKTWLALLAAVEVLEAGGAVIYLDYEDTGPGIARRLQRLGATRDRNPDLLDAILERFAYLSYDGVLGPGERHDIDRKVDTLNPDLVIIDGVAEALARDGFDEDRNADVVLWTEKLPRPLARAGAAVLMLDHVVKSRENRGRGGRGAGHKLAAVDGASYALTVTRSFSTEVEGSVVIKIDKDRPGAVGPIGTEAGSLIVKPSHRGDRVDLDLLSPHDPGGIIEPTKPTRMMLSIVHELDHAKSDLTRRSIVSMLPGHDKTKTAALEHLLAGGYIEEVTRGGRKVLVVRAPYEPGADLGPDPEYADTAPETTGRPVNTRGYERDFPELF